MSTPTAVPWIQFDENVVGENMPDATPDVDNRPLKFVITQSDFDETALFPGFMIRNVGSGSPNGVVSGAIGHAYIDQPGQTVYFKLTPSGSTGWQALSGNRVGSGSPENVVVAAVGQIYEQRDAAVNTNPLWVKRTGVTSVGWRAIAGFAGSGTNSLEIGAGASAPANTSIAIGPTAVNAAAATDAVTIGNSSTNNVVSGVNVGKGNTVNVNAGPSSIVIGNTNTLNAFLTNVGSEIVIGSNNLVTSASGRIDDVIAIGRNISINVNGQTADIIAIGRGVTITTNSTGVYIGATLSITGAGCAGVVIGAGASSAVSDPSLVLIGQGATRTTGGNGGTAVGASSTASGVTPTAVGSNCKVFGGASCAYGSAAQVQNTDSNFAECIAIGVTAVTVAGVYQAIRIGNAGSVATGHQGSIIIGSRISSDARQQFKVGSIDSGVGGAKSITTVFIGGPDTEAAYPGITYRCVNGTGTNNAVGNWTIIAPRSTGSATPGAFVVQTGDVLASGTTLQTVTTRLTIGQNTTFTLTHNPAAAANGFLFKVSGTIVEAASGNHVRLSGAEFLAPTITVGVATVTDAVTLYIDNAPTATVTGGTWAFWIAAGTARFDGDCLHTTDRSSKFTNQTSSAGALAGTLLNAPTAGDPAFWLRLMINGTNYAIPAWLG